jgi:hypothetical protein
MYRSSELIYEALIQTHGVVIFLCMHVECYAHSCFTLSVVHLL